MVEKGKSREIELKHSNLKKSKREMMNKEMKIIKDKIIKKLKHIVTQVLPECSNVKNVKLDFIRKKRNDTSVVVIVTLVSVQPNVLNVILDMN